MFEDENEDENEDDSNFALVSQSLTAPSRFIGTDKLKDQCMKIHFYGLALASMGPP